MNGTPLHVYIGELFKGVASLPILNQHLGVKQDGSNKLFRKIFKQVSFSFFVLTEKPEEADLFLIPHDYFRIHTRRDYLEQFTHLARQHGKKLVVVVYGDSDEEVVMPGAVILRTSQYRHKLSPQEIVMPGYTEDLLHDRLLLLRKKSTKPIIGFCGWADFPNLKGKIKFWSRIILQDLRTYLLFDAHAQVHKQGIFFRQRAMEYLKRATSVQTNFVIRRSYSGHKMTIELPEAQARAEYVNNILDSDFTLCVKGDGNWSYRFYETLALGRLLVLVDTETLLPLEDRIDYGAFVIRVPSNQLETIADRVSLFYSSLSDEEYARRQQKARDAFVQFLRIDSFLRVVFTEIVGERLADDTERL